MARPLYKRVLAVAFAKKPVNILSYSELSMIMSFFHVSLLAWIKVILIMVILNMGILHLNINTCIVILNTSLDVPWHVFDITILSFSTYRPGFHVRASMLRYHIKTAPSSKASILLKSSGKILYNTSNNFALL